MNTYYLRPIGSMYSRPQEKTVGYIDLIGRLPPKIKNVLISSTIGSYIKGLGASYNIPQELQPNIAFAILELFIGKKTFTQLPAVLSTELTLPNDKAQKMALEIEQDVFGSIKVELDEFLRKQKASANSITSKIGMVSPKASAPIKNVLNLKELTPPKSAKQLPPRPPRFPLPPTSRKGQGNENGIKTPPAPIRFT